MTELKLEHGPVVVRYDEDGPAVDYNKAFTEGTTYYDDEADEGSRKFSMDIQQSLDIELPTGAIVLSPPEGLAHDEQMYYLQRKVKPGTYPTFLAYAQNEDGRNEVAAWRINFRDIQPSRWEVGYDNKFQPPFEPYQIGGLGGIVDGCFGICDVGFLQAIRSRYKTEDKDLFDEFYHDGFLKAEERKGAVEIREGDVPGNYLRIYVDMPQHCFWGLDESDNPVCLVNDFFLLHREATKTETVGLLKDCCNKPLHFDAPVGRLLVHLDFDLESHEFVAKQLEMREHVSGHCSIDGQEQRRTGDKKTIRTGDEIVTVTYRVGTESIPILIEE